jgi:prevent-host-death family protein
MSEHIGAYVAKTKLPEILRSVEAGKTYTVTHRGKPVADISPSRLQSDQQLAQSIENLKQASAAQLPDSLYQKLLSECGR